MINCDIQFEANLLYIHILIFDFTDFENDLNSKYLRYFKMSIIFKLPCRRFKLGNNSLPSISSSLTYENRKRHKKFGDPRNHFHVLNIFHDESVRQNWSKPTSIHANELLCHLYFRRGIFGSPQFKDDRPERADQGQIPIRI